MPHFHLRLFVPHPHPNSIPNTILWPLSSVVEYTHCQSSAKESYNHEFVVKRMSPSFLCVSSLRLHPVRALKISVAVGETYRFCHSKVSIDSFEKQALYEKAQIKDYCSSVDSLSDEDHKKKQRRRKIEHGNKGKVPWNKGRKHTEETCVRIKQRTLEALSDPKVRQKMSEHPRPHSDQTKARIRSSLRQVWGKRLKWKRLREKFFNSWLESIAKAAKKGGSDQQELDWDSYDKIKQEIALQQLQWAADKAKAKEMSKMRRERAVLARAENMARLAQRRKELEERAKQSKEIKRKTRKMSNKNKEDLAVTKGLKLKQMLTKIHKKKIINGQVTIREETVIAHIPAWEKLDIELVKREKMRREVSLADQIQAAKSKRAESMAGEVLAASSAICPSSVRSAE